MAGRMRGHHDFAYRRRRETRWRARAWMLCGLRRWTAPERSHTVGGRARDDGRDGRPTAGVHLAVDAAAAAVPTTRGPRNERSERARAGAVSPRGVASAATTNTVR